jgi:hypothetical protein
MMGLSSYVCLITFLIVSVMDALAKKRRDDDEIMFFLLSALHLLGSTKEPRQKIPRHISRLPGKERLEEVFNGHVKDCCVAFRMEPNIFRAIATYLRDEHLLPSSYFPFSYLTSTSLKSHQICT